MKDRRNNPNWQVTDKMRARARSLRRESTGAERIVWAALRAHRLNGASFRRQAPIGPFIVDFLCNDAKLIVEIDGGQHFEAEHLACEARRDAYLRAKGFRVLRLNNHDVMTNRIGVLNVIDGVVANAPSPPLPRKRGREGKIEPLS